MSESNFNSKNDNNNCKMNNIVDLKCLIRNLDIKLSTVTETNAKNQILCVVLKNNDILFRYVSETGDLILKKLSWFHKNLKIIQDVCFDPNGTWLLVFCLDNTLHIVPALNIVDKSMSFKCIFSSNEITSFVVPFIGPHECPNAQKCPNQQINPEDGSFLDRQLKRPIKRDSSIPNLNGNPTNDTLRNNSSTSKINEFITSNSIYNSFYCDSQPNSNIHTTLSNSSSIKNNLSDIAKCDPEFFNSNINLNTNNNGNNNNQTNSNENNNNSMCTTPTPSQVMSCSMSSFVESSMMSSATGSTTSISTCPIPTALCWWKTVYEENRAILGYSDGNICVVSLVNHCPFVGNTSIEKGCIEKLLICRDTNLDATTLMINTTTKDQYKLLLEQKSNGYIFPNESSIHSMQIPSRSAKTENDNEWEFVNSSAVEANISAIEKTFFDSESAGPSTDENMSLPRIFPAAKARLLSLRDLGAKKIGTLKLKLAESRIKAKEKEKMKDQTAAAFAMINSNAITPELLTTPSGPYFIVQKAQNKNLLSALHSYSDTLSIHNIDISLIPLNLYKLPVNAKEALLTDNILYVIQNGPRTPVTATATETNINKETPSENTGSSKTLSNTRRIDSIDENLKGLEGNNENVQMQSTSATTATTNSSQEDNDNVNLTNNLQNTNLMLSDSYDNTVLSVISCALTSMKIGEDCEFQERALLGTFKFPANERIINIHRMTNVERVDDLNENENPANENVFDNTGQTEVKSTYSKYLNYGQKANLAQKFTDADRKVMRNEFPKVTFDKCLVVTDKNIYCVELKDKPHIVFLNMASSSLWTLCDDFCKTFNLKLPECVEFAGDVFLKKKRIEQALVTYNIARIPPIKTALKLAMFNEVNALRQITSMALRIPYILESKHPINPIITKIIQAAKERHIKSDVITKNLRNKHSTKHENTGKLCSDYSYENEEIAYDIQMSNSAQFHLSNLLFLTLCEKCVRDKNYMPLWNFIVTNTKYHTSLSSIILSQSGLFSTAVLLAMYRGACLDVFSCLVSASDHAIDISNEMQVMLYNLSEEIFMECIIYLQNYALDYFEIIRTNLDKLDEVVLQRLEKQLNPFDPVYRPILSKMKNQNIEKLTKEMEFKFVEFCKTFIETYILILVRLQKLRQHKDNFLNALNLFRVTSEERQNYIKLINYSPLSAGFSHCGCIADNSVYLWGTNGVNCATSKSVLQTDSTESDVTPTRVEFFKDCNLDVYSVHCGRSHTLFLTNNGLYAMGLNTLGQLGIGKTFNQALQPMLVRCLDNKSITQIAVGQHHNAVVADGKLYTWGWNIYGQLGHCDIYTVYEPKLVEFFRNKKIKQIALGQAHTLVLCYEKCGNLSTSLYVFGSNHYGQLGVGQSLEDLDEMSSGSSCERKKNLVKCAIPLKLNIDENIRLIHTKYFTNFAVTDSNRLYTWGLSPPELRIINQTKKRAKANQKLRDAMKNGEQQEEQKGNEENLVPEISVQVSGADDKENVSEDNKTDGPENLENPPPEEETNKDVPAIKIEECKSPAVEETKPTIEDAPTSVCEDKDEGISEDIYGNCEEYLGHLYPTEVDTFEVDGDIIYLSSGIYHNALITTKSFLYVWGKNIERQLGRESVKPDLFVPTKHHNVQDVKFVECGADFTLVITNDNELKAFGNNNQGQCGVENPNDKQQNTSKLIRFKSSKRVFRIPESSLYIDKPVNVRIPMQSQTTIINFSSNQPICYLKNLPKFKRNSLIESSLSKSIRKNLRNEEFFDEIDQNLINNNSSLSSLSSMTSNSSSKSSTLSSNEIAQLEMKYSNDYIHYCLYIFQGLYDESHFYDYFYQIQRGLQLDGQANMNTFTNEYKIRILMLNYNYIDAFKLALHNYRDDSQMSIKIFEYFTTDSNIIPMQIEDIKYFIYEIFLQFIKNKNLDLHELENYLLQNIDYYLLQLCFILYFSNNNNNNHNNNNNQINGLEKQLFEKFKHLYTNYDNFSYFECTELIFKSISTKFHCVLCQHLLKYSENFN